MFTEVNILNTLGKNTLDKNRLGKKVQLISSFFFTAWLQIFLEPQIYRSVFFRALHTPMMLRKNTICLIASPGAVTCIYDCILYAFALLTICLCGLLLASVSVQTCLLPFCS